MIGLKKTFTFKIKEWCLRMFWIRPFDLLHAMESGDKLSYGRTLSN